VSPPKPPIVATITDAIIVDVLRADRVVVQFRVCEDVRVEDAGVFDVLERCAGGYAGMRPSIAASACLLVCSASMVAADPSHPGQYASLVFARNALTGRRAKVFVESLHVGTRYHDNNCQIETLEQTPHAVGDWVVEGTPADVDAALGALTSEGYVPREAVQQLPPKTAASAVASSSSGRL
jgi:hypothetical protein